MARIAGSIGFDAHAPGRAVVDRMLAVVIGGDAHPSILSDGRATFGWAGLTDPLVARSNGVLVVMDGRLYEPVPDPRIGAAALIARWYRELGFIDAVAGLEGDFAVALYDPGDDTVWLARDGRGVRPLYYASPGGRFAFASRPRSLWEVPGVSRRVRGEYLALAAAGHYRHFDARPEASPYEDIAQLPAGHVLRLRHGAPELRAYWSFTELPDVQGPEIELAQRYRDLFLASVRRRLRTVERPAFTLSGGTDSSSVVAAAVHETGRPAVAFSVVYDDPTFDERREIRPVAEALLSDWHAIPVGTPDVLGLVRRMVREHDEPVATATWLSHFILCEEAARRGYPVLFGGLGGDELNAGEYEYFPYHFADLRAQGHASELRHEVECWIAHHDHPVFRKSAEVAESAMARLVDPAHPGRCIPDRRRLTRYVAALRPGPFRLETYDPPMDSPFTSYLRSRAYHDIVRETLPCCLRAQDRNGAHHGIEHVVPFLDRELVEFMFRVPGTMKIRDGITKRILREAMRGLLPEDTRTRVAKVGWNAPAHRWFAGKGVEMLLDLVRSRSFRERGIYDVAEVERLIREHDEIVRSGMPREDHMMFLWQVINVELWLDAIGDQTV